MITKKMYEKPTMEVVQLGQRQQLWPFCVINIRRKDKPFYSYFQILLIEFEFIPHAPGAHGCHAGAGSGAGLGLDAGFGAEAGSRSLGFW